MHDTDACNYDDEATDDNDSCVPWRPLRRRQRGHHQRRVERVVRVRGRRWREEATIAFDEYPSPVRDMLNLRLNGIVWSSEVEATILSSSGQVLRSERLAGRTQLDVSSLASGVYFLSLEAPSTAAVTRRFVVAGGE